MPRLLHLLGILKLEDNEFETLLEIFESMPRTVLLTSSYIAIKYAHSDILIPDGVVVEMAKIAETIPKESTWYAVIDKILQFRSQASITI